MAQTARPLILVADDVPDIRRSLREILEFENYRVAEARNGRECLDLVPQLLPQLVLLDIIMPILGGKDVLKSLRNSHPEIPVVMLSGEGNIHLAVEMVHMGAFHFIAKPPDLQTMLDIIRRALQHGGEPIQNASATKTPAPPDRKKAQTGRQLIGTSPAIRKAQADIESYAPTTLNILLTGETGTGKTYAAKILHERSARAKGPFVMLDCGAISPELIESELFGHRKGAFTNAHADRKGLFAEAAGGTIFLDEIGNMSLSAQMRLLKAVEEKKVRPVGSDTWVAVDVRVVSATNANLGEEMQAKSFRPDLFYRLGEREVRMPSLSQRPEDIPLLVQHLNEAESREANREPLTFDAEAMRLLQGQPWRGNIRELRAVIRCAVEFCRGRVGAGELRGFLMV